MNIDELIKIASDAYDDDGEGLVAQYHRDPAGEYGDTLAKFIASELAETFDAAAPAVAQLRTAHDLMSRATGDLAVVAAAFGKIVREAT